MSVNYATYVMFGAMLPYDEDLYEACEPYFDDGDPNPKGDVTILFDGMTGEYIAVGHVIAKSSEDEGFEKPISFDMVPEPAIPSAVNAALLEVGVKEGSRPPLGWFVISHYE